MPPNPITHSNADEHWSLRDSLIVHRLDVSAVALIHLSVILQSLHPQHTNDDNYWDIVASIAIGQLDLPLMRPALARKRWKAIGFGADQMPPLIWIDNISGELGGDAAVRPSAVRG